MDEKRLYRISEYNTDLKEFMDENEESGLTTLSTFAINNMLEYTGDLFFTDNEVKEILEENKNKKWWNRIFLIPYELNYK